MIGEEDKCFKQEWFQKIKYCIWSFWTKHFALKYGRSRHEYAPLMGPKWEGGEVIECDMKTRNLTINTRNHWKTWRWVLYSENAMVIWQSATATWWTFSKSATGPLPNFRCLTKWNIWNSAKLSCQWRHGVEPFPYVPKWRRSMALESGIDVKLL